MRKKSTKILLESVLIVLAACITAAAVNAARKDGIPFILEIGKGPSVKGIQKIDLAKAKDMFDSGKAVFLDCRSEDEFDLGHILGAKNLPNEQFEARFLDELDEANETTPIVAYCSGLDCHSSDMVAARLRDEGYNNLYVFLGGWPQWLEAKYPVSQIKERPLYKVN